HDRFREFCVSLAQMLYRTEVKMRTNVMGEPAKHIRPLSETRAIENGANFIAEGFLFTVAAGLILGESWRSSRNQTKRRDNVDDQLDTLGTQVTELTTRVNEITTRWEDELRSEKQRCVPLTLPYFCYAPIDHELSSLAALARNDELSRVLQRVVEIGLRGGWAEFEDTPLQIPRIQLAPGRPVDAPLSQYDARDTQIDSRDSKQSSDHDSSPSSPP
ncbi:hypothetical protein DXG03_002038, partial [Asterophora parasitica]